MVQKPQWVTQLLQRKRDDGSTQKETAAAMAAAQRELVGRALLLRFPKRLSLRRVVTLDDLNSRLGPGWLELLDGGAAAAAAVRGQPIEEAAPDMAALIAGLVLTDAWVAHSGGQATHLQHECMLSDTGFGLLMPRLLHALAYTR